MHPNRAPQASSARRHHVFDSVSEVEIDNLGGALVVKVGESPQIIVDVDRGSDDRVRAIQFTTETGILRVSDQSSGGDTNVIHMSGNSIHVSGSVVGGIMITGKCNQVYVNGRRIDTSATSGPEETPVTVTITVPRGTPVTVDGVEGDTTIGDTEGTIDATLSGVGNLKCGAVKKTKVKVSGSARASFTNVSGDFEAKVSGSGDITVSGGTIDTLEATVSGAGNITVNTTANQGALKVSGVGNITVKHVRRAPRQKVSGVGRINVGRIGQ